MKGGSDPLDFIIISCEGLRSKVKIRSFYIFFILNNIHMTVTALVQYNINIIGTNPWVIKSRD